MQQHLPEPKKLGPWVIDGRSPLRDWAFLCHHESTFENAVVELHFANSLDYGFDLQRAVYTNPKLIPLGAERLIGTGRLFPQSGEVWANAPQHLFQHWVARASLPRSYGEGITKDALHSAAQALKDMIEVAKADDLNLSLHEEDIWFSPSGRVQVERPGLPPYDDRDPYEAADAWLTREITKLANEATSISESLTAATVLAPRGGFNLAPGMEDVPTITQTVLVAQTDQAAQAAPPVQSARDEYPPNSWQVDQAKRAAQAANAKPASFLRRAAGYVIDWIGTIFLWISVFFCLGFFMGVTGIEFDVTKDAIIIPVTLLAFPVYHLFTVLIFGRTPGMWMLGMRLESTASKDLNRVSEFGAPPGARLSFGAALMRVVMLHVGSFLMLGYLWMLWDSSDETWHDKASSSRVVR